MATVNPAQAWKNVPLMDFSRQVQDRHSIHVGPFRKSEVSNALLTSTGLRITAMNQFERVDGAAGLADAIAAVQPRLEEPRAGDTGYKFRRGERYSLVMQDPKSGAFYATRPDEGIGWGDSVLDRKWWANDRREQVITVKPAHPDLRAVVFNGGRPAVTFESGNSDAVVMREVID